MMSILAVLAALALCAAQWFIWVHAPVEATLGLIQKIFYVHMPLAGWSMVSFLVCFLASAGYLWRRRPALDLLAGASAEIGVVFSGLALVTGSLWARASWNVWWTWDPRLTTTLIMWFVYAAYLSLRASALPAERKSLAAAVLGVVAFLDVPLVFMSARMWRSIHPAVLASQGGGLEPEMLTTLFFCLGAVGLLWLWLVLFRARQLAAAARIEAAMVFDR
jgi:heme exporter protein C